jgi:hypothetical protein
MTDSQQHSRTGFVVLLAAACLTLGSTGGAVAGAMITGKQIKDGSVTGKDIKDKSIEAVDLAASAQHAGPQGPKGDPGTPGTPGAPGTPGTPGASGFSVVGGDTVSAPSGQFTSVEAECPAGQTALGGGGGLTSSTAVYIVESRPINGPVASIKRWFVKYYNASGSPQNVFAVATCATVS